MKRIIAKLKKIGSTESIKDDPNEDGVNFLEIVPTDVIVNNILTYLLVHQLLEICRVSKDFLKLASDDRLWKMFVNEIQFKNKDDVGYKAFFKTHMMHHSQYCYLFFSANNLLGQFKELLMKYKGTVFYSMVDEFLCKEVSASKANILKKLTKDNVFSDKLIVAIKFLKQLLRFTNEFFIKLSPHTSNSSVKSVASSAEFHDFLVKAIIANGNKTQLFTDSKCLEKLCDYFSKFPKDSNSDKIPLRTRFCCVTAVLKEILTHPQLLQLLDVLFDKIDALFKETPDIIEIDTKALVNELKSDEIPRYTKH